MNQHGSSYCHVCLHNGYSFKNWSSKGMMSIYTTFLDLHNTMCFLFRLKKGHRLRIIILCLMDCGVVDLTNPPPSLMKLQEWSKWFATHPATTLQQSSKSLGRRCWCGQWPVDQLGFISTLVFRMVCWNFWGSSPSTCKIAKARPAPAVSVVCLWKFDLLGEDADVDTCITTSSLLLSHIRTDLPFNLPWVEGLDLWQRVSQPVKLSRIGVLNDV